MTLQYSKKMLLVDPSQRHQQQASTPMDREIRDALSEQMPDDIKAKLYHSILSKYVRVSAPPPIPPMSETEILNSIPDKNRYKGKRLLAIIRDSHEGEWNSRGELIYRQTLLPNSSIIDLLDAALKTSSDPLPIGWEHFADILKRGGVWRDLIVNNKIWDYINPPPRKSARKQKKKKAWVEY